MILPPEILGTIAHLHERAHDLLDDLDTVLESIQQTVALSSHEISVLNWCAVRVHIGVNGMCGINNVVRAEIN